MIGVWIIAGTNILMNFQAARNKEQQYWSNY
jgi:hypothetical protein